MTFSRRVIIIAVKNFANSCFKKLIIRIFLTKPELFMSI